MSTELYRPINEEKDWSFFDAESTIPTCDKTKIHALSEVAALRFWEQHISPLKRQRHPMLLPMEHWLRPDIIGPDWLNDAGQRDDSRIAVVATSLNLHFNLALDERIYFVLMRERIYTTSISIFTRHWTEFLFLGDESPFLFHPGSGAFACFGPNGQLHFGRKK